MFFSVISFRRCYPLFRHYAGGLLLHSEYDVISFSFIVPLEDEHSGLAESVTQFYLE